MADNQQAGAFAPAEISHKRTALPKHLGEVARRLYLERRIRDETIACSFLNEGVWDLLLDLYACSASGERVSITSACAAACIPTTTAHRLITKLERSGMVRRELEECDRRVRYVLLTNEAAEMMSRFLHTVATNRRKWT
jgi:DNA-binding MarR family transcriptional regulator